MLDYKLEINKKKHAHVVTRDALMCPFRHQHRGGGNHARQGDFWGRLTDTRDTEEVAEGTVISNNVQKE
jgi:hypothetical protein